MNCNCRVADAEAKCSIGMSPLPFTANTYQIPAEGAADHIHRLVNADLNTNMLPFLASTS